MENGEYRKQLDQLTITGLGSGTRTGDDSIRPILTINEGSNFLSELFLYNV
jgi:hypothetical protein